MAEIEMFSEYPDVVTIQDLQPMLRIGRVLAYELVHSNAIISFRVGKCIRISKKNVIAYVKNQTAA